MKLENIVLVCLIVLGQVLISWAGTDFINGKNWRIFPKTYSFEINEYSLNEIPFGWVKNYSQGGVVNKLRYTTEVGGWLVKYNHCKFY